MQRRRELLTMPHVLDTSPKILQYGVRYSNASTISAPEACITALYDCVNNNSDDRYGVAYGLWYTNTYWKDGVRIDWRNDGDATITPKEGLYFYMYQNTNQVSFTLKTDMIDNCYLYQKTTGRIFFAGKNSIYYGHRNISELN